MTITPEIWKILAKAIESTHESPAWLKEQASLSWETISKLPAFDASSRGQHSQPTVEIRPVAPDYLDFLREQIRLDPRGPEWLALLKQRLAALEPFVGKSLMVATFYSKPHSATFRIRSGADEVVYVEID